MRALAVLLLLALVWLAARLPGVERRFLAAVAAGAPTGVPVVAAAVVPAGRDRGLIDAALAPAGRATRRQSSGVGVCTSRGFAATPGRPATKVAAAPFRLSPSPQQETTAAFKFDEVEPIAPAPPPPPAAPPGFELATRAYAALAAGDRRAAKQLFGAALLAAGTPGPPPAEAWRREQRRLARHWSGDVYTLRRDTGIGGAAASPVLGGGQSGGTLAWAIDPLASRPVAVIGRVYAAHARGGGIDGDTAQAAVGVRWQVTPGVTLAAERLIAVGAATAGDWNLRVAGGGQVRHGRLTLDGYGEAGVRGNGDAYAGGQARANAEIARARQLVISAGPGAWGSIQRAQTTIGRLDLGAGVTLATPVGVAFSADWRWRVAGDAAPGSGPAVTVSAAF